MGAYVLFAETIVRDYMSRNRNKYSEAYIEGYVDSLIATTIPNFKFFSRVQLVGHLESLKYLKTRQDYLKKYALPDKYLKKYIIKVEKLVSDARLKSAKAAKSLDAVL